MLLPVSPDGCQLLPNPFLEFVHKVAHGGKNPLPEFSRGSLFCLRQLDLEIRQLLFPDLPHRGLDSHPAGCNECRKFLLEPFLTRFEFSTVFIMESPLESVEGFSFPCRKALSGHRPGLGKLEDHHDGDDKAEDHDRFRDRFQDDHRA